MGNIEQTAHLFMNYLSLLLYGGWGEDRKTEGKKKPEKEEKNERRKKQKNQSLPWTLI